jgi:CBS domain-containing protein
MVLALLLLVGCASEPTPQVESAPPTAEASSPSSPVAQAPATTATARPSSEESAIANPATDTTVIPGERLGPVTPTATRRDLVSLFGEDHLADQAVDVGEGETENGTVVNQGSDSTFTVVWTDDSKTKIAAITHLGSAWKTPEGIGIGTSFDELKAKLGAFKLYGLDWDYGGTVVLEGSNLAKYDGLLILRLQPAENASEQAASDYEAVTGDRLFESTDPHFDNLGLKVNDMAVYLGQSSQ